MMKINLFMPPGRGAFFDDDATGLLRFVPRRAWWPVIPVLVLGAPMIACVVVVDRLTRGQGAVVA
jgi:hypothetical protein